MSSAKCRLFCLGLNVLNSLMPDAECMRRWIDYVNIGSCNDLAPIQCQAISSTSAGLLSSGA